MPTYNTRTPQRKEDVIDTIIEEVLSDAIELAAEKLLKMFPPKVEMIRDAAAGNGAGAIVAQVDATQTLEAVKMLEMKLREKLR